MKPVTKADICLSGFDSGQFAVIFILLTAHYKLQTTPTGGSSPGSQPQLL
jgi:hypothetical protein